MASSLLTSSSCDVRKLSPVACLSDRCPHPNIVESRDQLRCHYGLEQSIHAERAEVGERRLVEGAGVHPTASGRMVDYEIHKLDLISIEALSLAGSRQRFRETVVAACS